MKHLELAAVLLLVSSGTALAQASPFAGTWKLDTAKSQFTRDTFTVSKTAAGLHYSNGGPVSFDFAIDGKDYPVIPGRTTAWTKAADGGWDQVAKTDGKVLSKAHRVLSLDGKTLTSTYVGYRPDGTESHESDVYTRVSGSHGLEGEWKDVKVKAATDTMMISASPGRYEIKTPSYKESISGSTDGAPAEIKGPTVPPGAMASYKATGPAEWTYSITLKGTVYDKGVMTVSPDGRTMTDTSWIPGKESEKVVAVYQKT
jgi:hypothetical protein